MVGPRPRRLLAPARAEVGPVRDPDPVDTAGHGRRPQHLGHLDPLDQRLGVLVPVLGVRQGTADRVPRRVRRRQLAQDHRPRDGGARDAARAGPGDAGDRRARPRLGPRLRRDRGGGPVHRGRGMAASRRVGRSGHHRVPARRGGAPGGRRARVPLPGRTHRGLPASVRQPQRRRLTSSTSRPSRSGPGRSSGAAPARRRPRSGSFPSRPQTSSSRRSANASASPAPRSSYRCTH